MAHEERSAIRSMPINSRNLFSGYEQRIIVAQNGTNEVARISNERRPDERALRLASQELDLSKQLLDLSDKGLTIYNHLFSIG
jgi:hypothetical protein